MLLFMFLICFDNSLRQHQGIIDSRLQIKVGTALPDMLSTTGESPLWFPKSFLYILRTHEMKVCVFQSHYDPHYKLLLFPAITIGVNLDSWWVTLGVLRLREMVLLNVTSLQNTTDHSAQANGYVLVLLNFS